MRELRSRIEGLLKDYRDEAASEERFVSEVLAVLAMGSVARGRMIAEMAQIVAKHTSGFRSPEEDEPRTTIGELVRAEFTTSYKQ